MADVLTIRQRIVDNLTETLSRHVRDLDGVEYDKHFDDARAPFAWVYDLEEEYDAERTTGQVWSDLRCAVYLAFRYDGEDGLRRTGNMWLGRVFGAVLADPERGGWAFDTIPESSVTIDAAETPTVGALLTIWRVRYYTKHDDMTTQRVVA